MPHLLRPIYYVPHRTGYRIGKKLLYASTCYAHFSVHDQRGRRAVRDMLEVYGPMLTMLPGFLHTPLETPRLSGDQ